MAPSPLSPPLLDHAQCASSTLSNDDTDEGMRRFAKSGCCGGVIDDVRRRSRFCTADYIDGVRFWRKTIAASLFMFFATFFSTVALGTLIQIKTNQRIGLVECACACAMRATLQPPARASSVLVHQPPDSRPAAFSQTYS